MSLRSLSISRLDLRSGSVPCPRAACLTVLLAAACRLWPGQPVAAQPQQPKPASPAAEDGAQPSIQTLLERLEKVEQELARLRQAAPGGGAARPGEKRDGGIHLLLETPYLGHSYYGNDGGKRFLAGRLTFVNLTGKAVTVKRGDIQLVADGKEYELQDIPSSIRYQSFQVGNEQHQLRNMNPAKEVVLQAGGTGSTPVVFAELPPGNQVPTLALKLNIDGTARTLDINEYALGLLGMKLERIGPRESLALITIGGQFNTINVGYLVEQLDQLAGKQVARAVISWSENAAPLESQMLSWLQQSAQMAGRGEVNNNRFPTIPATIRELHLAAIPNGDNQTPSANVRNSVPRASLGPVSLRVHKTPADAVRAALKSAYAALPLDELSKSLEEGHPLARAAALSTGGGRLPAEQLPTVLKFADDDDPVFQQAALLALRHYGDEAAIAKLVEYAKRNTEPLAATAVESLAASRFAAAHRVLLEILKNEPPKSRLRIVETLAAWPRPIWSETIYTFVTENNPPTSVEGLRALIRIGHPKLQEVLEQALKSTNTTVRDEAFGVLSTMSNPEAEEVALEFTLRHLADSPPTQPMMILLTRTRDPRAVPSLLKLLEKKDTGTRTQVISTLAQIGDQTVTAALEKLYPQLEEQEQSVVLNALMQLRSPRFRELAREAVRSDNGSLVNTACRGLQQDGSPEAVRILTETLARRESKSSWSYVINALSVLGTPAARDALRKARDSGDNNVRQMALNGLQQMQQRSPGYQYIHRGRSYMQQEKWKEAIEMYTVALEVDPQLAAAWSGRANARLKQDDIGKARNDFRQALQIDPWDAQAVTGLGICLVAEGKLDSGVKYVEDAREKFKQDMTFAFNTACVYSRALSWAEAHEDTENRDERIATYRDKALAELKRSVELGFRDFNWMRKDPDLKPLHDIKAFQEIHTPGTGARPGNARAVLQQRPVQVQGLQLVPGG